MFGIYYKNNAMQSLCSPWFISAQRVHNECITSAVNQCSSWLKNICKVLPISQDYYIFEQISFYHLNYTNVFKSA